MTISRGKKMKGKYVEPIHITFNTIGVEKNIWIDDGGTLPSHQKEKLNRWQSFIEAEINTTNLKIEWEICDTGFNVWVENTWNYMWFCTRIGKYVGSLYAKF